MSHPEEEAKARRLRSTFASVRLSVDEWSHVCGALQTVADMIAAAPDAEDNRKTLEALHSKVRDAVTESIRSAT